jgi:hypothetical protein
MDSAIAQSATRAKYRAQVVMEVRKSTARRCGQEACRDFAAATLDIRRIGAETKGGANAGTTNK